MIYSHTFFKVYLPNHNLFYLYVVFLNNIVKNRKYKKSLNNIFAHGENNVVEHEKLINFGSLGKVPFSPLQWK